jgi:hypothetical protein
MKSNVQAVLTRHQSTGRRKSYVYERAMKMDEGRNYHNSENVQGRLHVTAQRERESSPIHIYISQELSNNATLYMAVFSEKHQTAESNNSCCRFHV